MKRYNIKVNEQNFTVDVEQLSPDKLNLKVNNNMYSIAVDELLVYSKNKDDIGIKHQSQNSQAAPANNNLTAEPSVSSPVQTNNKVMRSQISGQVIEIYIQEGDTVKIGDIICLVELMKMETAIYSTINGAIKKLLIEKNAIIKSNQEIFEYA